MGHLDPILAVVEGDGRVVRGAQEAHGAGGVQERDDREALGVERSHWRWTDCSEGNWIDPWAVGRRPQLFFASFFVNHKKGRK